LIVEEARVFERNVVVAITLAAYGEYEEGSSPEFWTKYCENIRQAILHNALVTVLVARDQATIKGSVLFCAPNAGAVKNELPEMRLLAVPPEYRNLGIAKLLIDECERRAAASGALTLHTTRLMTTAMAMYERRGYTRLPAIDFEPVPGFLVMGYSKKLPALELQQAVK
jgi:ribosomal protein S18 acetylase RimI-like enzyme